MHETEPPRSPDQWIGKMRETAAEAALTPGPTPLESAEITAAYYRNIGFDGARVNTFGEVVTTTWPKLTGDPEPPRQPPSNDQRSQKPQLPVHNSSVTDPEKALGRMHVIQQSNAFWARRERTKLEIDEWRWQKKERLRFLIDNFIILSQAERMRFLRRVAVPEQIAKMKALGIWEDIISGPTPEKRKQIEQVLDWAKDKDTLEIIDPCSSEGQAILLARASWKYELWLRRSKKARQHRTK